MRPAISTRTGDGGKTGLIGGGRVSKSADRIQAIGSVDELNSIFGLLLTEKDLPSLLREQLDSMQHTLFVLGADLASLSVSPSACITLKDVELLEQWASNLEQQLPSLSNFILPRGNVVACLLHQARATCRRAERWVIALAEKEDVREPVRIYLNRLSDYLFLAARISNKDAGIDETEWISS